MKPMLIVIFCLLLPAQVWAQYKCLSADGSISYRDSPCPTNQSSRPIDGAQNQSNGKRRPSTTTVQSPIDFGSSSEARLIKALALLDSIAVDGRDCEWSLKVDRRELEACSAFAKQVVEGGPWSQTLDVLSELRKDSDFAIPRVSEFQRALSVNRRIAQYSQFMQARLLK